MAFLQEDVFRLAESGSALFVECLGSFFISVIFGFNVTTGSMVWMPTSVAFAVMVGMAGAANVSGGHLNPAVTLSFGLARKMGWLRVCGYLVSQFVGALCGGFVVTGLVGTEIRVSPRFGFDVWDLFLVEVAFTGLTCFVALNCMASVRCNAKQRQNQFAPIAVGFTYLAGGQAASGISGAFFNPAVATAFAVCGPPDDRHWLHFYGAFHALGAVAAALLFFMVRPEEFLVFGQLEGEGLDWRRACGVVCPFCFGQDPVVRPAKEEQDQRHEQALLLQLENYASPLPARLFAEFLGTFLMVLTFGLSIASGHLISDASKKGGGREGITGGNTDDLGGLILEDVKAIGVAAHWSTGAALISLSYALCDVSGAQFNPAVTLAAAMSSPGVCRTAEAIFCVVCQLGAGIVAAVLHAGLAHRHHDRSLVFRELGPGDGHRWRSVVFCETTFTCILALIALSVGTVKSQRYPRVSTVRNFGFGLAVGFCFAGAGLAIDTHTGGVLNPAIAISIFAGNLLGAGPKTVTKHVAELVTYVAYEMLGGAIASGIFLVNHPLEYKRDMFAV